MSVAGLVMLGKFAHSEPHFKGLVRCQRDDGGAAVRHSANMLDDQTFGANLKRLRLAKGWSQERLAAESGVGSKGYISQLETSERPIPPGRSLEALARALDVAAQDLVGSQRSAPETFVPIIGKLGADNTGEVIHVDAHGGHDTVPLPPGGSAKAVALEVVGDSMPWLAPAGALVYFEDQRTPPTEDMVYYYVVAELDDGRVLLKRLLRGSEPGLWTLESQIGPPIENVRIRWAAEPTAIVPPRQARLIIKRSGHSQVA